MKIQFIAFLSRMLKKEVTSEFHFGTHRSYGGHLMDTE